MTEAAAETSPAPPTEMTVDISGTEAMVRLFEVISGVPRPAGMAAETLVAGLKPELATQLQAMAHVVIDYVCGCWAQAITASGGVAAPMQTLTTGRAH